MSSLVTAGTSCVFLFCLAFKNVLVEGWSALSSLFLKNILHFEIITDLQEVMRLVTEPSCASHASPAVTPGSAAVLEPGPCVEALPLNWTAGLCGFAASCVCGVGMCV